MICEKCAGEVETVLCKSCGGNIVKLGPFCYACGTKFEKEREEAEEGAGINLEDRILCSDGTCIGVVENGVCKLCGKPYVPET